MKGYDAIVVGVGGMGSATVYDLARRGKRVLGLERFDIPNERGSSHGVNRIIRLAYYEDPAYVPLLRRSYQLWEEISRRSSQQLLIKTGSIDTDTEDGTVFSGSLRSCEIHEIPHEVLSAADTNRRFPGYRLPPGHFSLLQPDGGFVLSEQAISAFAAAGESEGAEIHTREAVSGWDVTGSGSIKVRTDIGNYECESLIVTAGAWSAGLIPDLRDIASAERQVLAWFDPAEPELFAPERFPVFNAMFDEGRYYGFPVFGIPGFKIGRYHHLEEQTDPDEVAREVSSADEEVLRSAVQRYFPGAAGRVLTVKTCMFTNSPDEHFIIGSPDGQPRVFFAAGFSGHGFKFASVIGEIMAELAIDGSTRHAISMFSPDRFAAAGQGA